MGTKLDLTGLKFNKLTALHISNRTAHGKIKWLCKCDCGNKLEVIGSHLKNGNTKSCGCYQKEQTGNAARKHGHAKTPTYNIWKSMRQRCNNPNDTAFHNYGGRGIKVNDDWNDYSVFIKDMGEKPNKKSLDRIDNNKDYSKNNCRWATKQEQDCNRRNNVLLTLNNKTQTMTQWATELNVPYGRLETRHKNGWSDIDTLTKPKRYRI